MNDEKAGRRNRQRVERLLEAYRQGDASAFQKLLRIKNEEIQQAVNEALKKHGIEGIVAEYIHTGVFFWLGEKCMQPQVNYKTFSAAIQSAVRSSLQAVKEILERESGSAQSATGSPLETFREASGKKGRGRRIPLKEIGVKMPLLSEATSREDLLKEIGLLFKQVPYLSQREVEVLKRYYLEGRSLQAVGKSLEVSMERVRMIRNSALKKIRKYFKLTGWGRMPEEVTKPLRLSKGRAFIERAVMVENMFELLERLHAEKSVFALKKPKPRQFGYKRPKAKVR